MDRGALVGDDVMIGIVRERLARPDARAGSCSTGFRARCRRPRRSTRCSTGGRPLIVVEIQVPDEELVRRVRGRRMCDAAARSASAFDGRAAADDVLQKCGGGWCSGPTTAKRSCGSG